MNAGLIAWFYKEGESVSICISNQKHNPLKLLRLQENTESTKAIKGTIWQGTLQEQHQGGGFISAGGQQFFIRNVGSKPRGTKIMVQLKTNADADKAPRVSQNIQLENHYCSYTFQAGQAIKQPPQGILKIKGMNLKSTADNIDKTLLENHATQLLERAQSILQISENNDGLVVENPAIAEQAFYYPLSRFYIHKSIDALLVKNIAHSMAVELPIDQRDDVKLFIDETRETQGAQSCFHNDIEMVTQKTAMCWNIDINSAGYRQNYRNNETMAADINDSLLQTLVNLIYLKNMRGVVVIDFISMRNPKNRKQLFDTMKTYAENTEKLMGLEPLQLYGWTRAGLFEIKANPPLYG